MYIYICKHTIVYFKKLRIVCKVIEVGCNQVKIITLLI